MGRCLCTGLFAELRGESSGAAARRNGHGGGRKPVPDARGAQIAQLTVEDALMRKTLVATAIVALTTLLVHAAEPGSGAINITQFADVVIDPGGEAEDWQPAFQKAIELARAETRPIYLPTGEYKIRKAVEILPVEEPQNATARNSIRIVGDGQHSSIISQQVETENVINWTGATYEVPCNFGHISHVCIKGGAIGLNVKWHNYFTMDSCYVLGAKVHGIYAEGWSSRFVNSTLRWCTNDAIWGGAHFNNCVIRDCYFSRDGVGVRISNGCYGSRIEGCAFELCAKAAIYIRGTLSFTINNSYFEGNGYRDAHPDLFAVTGSADTIHLDYSCKQVTIHDNILRQNKDAEGALISVAYAIGGHIYDNMLYNSPKGIVLRGHCETNEKAEPFVGRMVVERNLALKVETPFGEEEPGLVRKAITRGAAFRTSVRRTCEGDPTGTQQPECLGDEILDVTAKRWYKATGPSPADWVPLN